MVMKVLCVNAVRERLTVGKWYNVLEPEISFDEKGKSFHTNFLIYDDMGSGIPYFHSAEHFITEQEHRDKKLTDLLTDVRK